MKDFVLKHCLSGPFLQFLYKSRFPIATCFVYLGAFSNKYLSKIMGKEIWYFEDIDLYNILCPNKLDKHLETYPYIKFNKGDFVFMQQDNAQEIYLIAEGKVKIGQYHGDGNEYVKAYLGRGELLGETAFLGEKKYKDFAQCATDGTKICKMSAQKAQELSRDYVPFALELHKKIVGNVKRLERKLEILFFKDTRRRLEELLKDLYDLHHGDSKAGWIDHGLTQQEMASLIGASRKTVSLMLNNFEREGIIALSSGKFKFKTVPVPTKTFL